jgi:hypothetical protein
MVKTIKLNRTYKQSTTLINWKIIKLMKIGVSNNRYAERRIMKNGNKK